MSANVPLILVTPVMPSAEQMRNWGYSTALSPDAGEQIDRDGPARLAGTPDRQQPARCQRGAVAVGKSTRARGEPAAYPGGGR